MNSSTTALTNLTSAVLWKTREFAQRMQDRMPSTLCDVGHYSNEAFLLRSFVSMRAGADGDELALCVDVTVRPANTAGSVVSIECDLCLENGTIVAIGPSGQIDAASTEADVHIAAWTRQFDVFLIRAESEACKMLQAMAPVAKGNPFTPR